MGEPHLRLYKGDVTVLPDCEAWYEAGYTTSGVYFINPDGGTSFEVVSIIHLFLHLTTCIYRPIVTWKMMVVDELSFKEEWMALLTSISTGLIIFMVLVTSQESIG